MSNELIRIYTDGACSGNPGPGGFGWVLLFKDRKIEHADGEEVTTNNRMELSAVISALQFFDDNKKSSKKYKIEIHTDSNLIVQAINQRWLESWVQKGWKKADKEPVKNRELWEELLKFLKKYAVEFIWVKGHAGEEFNERCDTLARDAAKGILRNYHKSFKLVKTPENLFESEQEEKEIPKIKKMKEEETSQSNVTNFVFEYRPKAKQVIIEQVFSSEIENEIHEKMGKIVLTTKNLEEFQNKLNQIITNLKK